ncbi:hypothetical protein E6W36_09530 [Hankyongella ginsenosidimutans]|uniref:PEP-CTERM system histidine kinase PrsK n=1 Tax=Hankyongella ginsenosidimutans TaxID=1763828 RepID=A0A4D7C9N4_9SPHN|nr:hypothetical protein [Hankyongella ginsenosidimutans]QCI79683.1 hypothetical protein E6W36_09530 [Hankyongella ginsenosidimutans]
MHEQLSSVGLLSHGLAAAGFLALAAILLSRREQTASSLWLVVAALTTALWNIVNLTSDMLLHERAAIVSLMETVRTAAWIMFLASLLVRFWRVSEQISHSFLWAVALSFIFAFQILADGAHLAGLTQSWAQSYPLISPLFLVGRLACAIGGLVLVHNVYVNANPMHRWGIRSLCIGVGGLFAYDLNLYTLTILNGSPGEALINARGMVNLLVVPLIILSARRNRLWKLDIQVSRQVVFQSLSLIGIGGYFIAMSLASYGLRLIGGSIGGLLQVSFLFACVMMAIVVMSSGRFRAWAKVKINKHFSPTNTITARSGCALSPLCPARRRSRPACTRVSFRRFATSWTRPAARCGCRMRRARSAWPRAGISARPAAAWRRRTDP